MKIHKDERSEGNGCWERRQQISISSCPIILQMKKSCYKNICKMEEEHGFHNLTYMTRKDC
jgi:hypothetical protein